MTRKPRKLTAAEKLRKINLQLAAVRRAGRDAWMGRTAARNPHRKGTISAYIWDAGYKQDVRSIEELQYDWMLSEQSPAETVERVL